MGWWVRTRRVDRVDDSGGAVTDVPIRRVVKPEPMPDFDSHIQTFGDAVGKTSTNTLDTPPRVSP